MTGSSLRDADGRQLAWDRAAERRRGRARRRHPARRSSGTYTVNGRRCTPVFQLIAERYLDPLRRRTRWRRAAACRPKRSGGSRPSWRMWRSSRRSSCRSPGPTGEDVVTRRCAGGRSPCMRCAASPPIPTAFTPAARCICCRCCSAPSTCRAASASSRPIRSRRRLHQRPSGKDGGRPDTPLSGMPLGFVERAGGPAGRWRRRADPHRQGLFLGGAARRPRPDAHGDLATPGAAIPTRSTRCSCTWPTWRGTRR